MTYCTLNSDSSLITLAAWCVTLRLLRTYSRLHKTGITTEL